MLGSSSSGSFWVTTWTAWNTTWAIKTKSRAIHFWFCQGESNAHVLRFTCDFKMDVEPVLRVKKLSSNATLPERGSAHAGTEIKEISKLISLLMFSWL
jgi:hypothetical protein